MLDDLVGGAALHNAALVVDDEGVGQAVGLPKIVSDQDHGQVELPADRQEKPTHLAAQGIVQGGGGLIQQQGGDQGTWRESRREKSSELSTGKTSGQRAGGSRKPNFRKISRVCGRVRAATNSRAATSLLLCFRTAAG